MMKLMKFIGTTTYVAIASMMLTQCTGCKSIGHGCWWVAVGVGEWRQDIKNSSQRDKHTNAFGKKMKTEQPMITIYDASTFPIGKTTSVHYKRWISLFADGSFLALESRTTIKFLAPGRKNLVYISGQWERGEGTKVNLRCQGGTSFGKDVSIDLSSSTNFPPAKAFPPWHFLHLHETRSALPEDMNQVETGD